MAHRLLWLVAVLMAALALVAGCFKVNVPEGPYVTVREQPRPPSPQDQGRVHAMDKQALESEVLRLAGENDSLRQECDRLKRENKMLKKDNEQLKDQIKDLRKR
jgi:peptidoglycan hydrolase CwlO-like protein